MAADDEILHVAYPLVNDWALLLLVLTVVVGVYATYLARPSPLVHPLLLGRQSELSSTREKGSSGVYRSFAAGHGPPLTVRPSSSLKTLVNVLDPSCPARFIYGEKISNDLLKLRASNTGKGLDAIFHLNAKQKGAAGVLNLLPDGFDSVLLTLALAAHPTPAHPLQTISSPHLLAHVLEQRTPPAVVVLPARLARPVLEQLIDEEGSETPTSALVVVGEDGEAADVFALAEKHGVVAVAWKDVEVIGDDVADPAEPREASERDVLVKRFWEDAQGTVQETAITHVALTAGIAGILSLFPAHKRPSTASKDTVASCLGLEQPVGLALALAAIWSGAGFRTFGPASGWDSVGDEIEPDLDPKTSPAVQMTSLLLPGADKPTIAFLNTPHLAALTSALVDSASTKPLYAIAKRQKLADLSEGYLSREGLVEKYFWSRVRSGALGGLASSLRAVIVVDGELTPTLLQAARVHLATPITNLTTSALSTTPVFLTHFHDLQSLPSAAAPSAGLRELRFTPKTSRAYSEKAPTVVPQELELPQEGVAHTGPPAVNVEVKLTGVDDEQVEDGAEDVQGDVWIRGPGVLADGWTKTGLRAQALKNGTFQIL